MKIEKVIYELYESDYSYIKDITEADAHEIDREIYLVLDNGKHIYISWSNEPMQFSVGYKDHHWFKNEPDKTMEATSWKIWKDTIGQEFEFVYHDKNNQVLELKSTNTSVYFAPLEKENNNWSIDVLHISNTLPTVGS